MTQSFFLVICIETLEINHRILHSIHSLDVCTCHKMMHGR